MSDQDLSRANLAPSWDEYKHLSNLFRFYLQLILKAFTMSLGIAGAVTAFVLGKEVDNPRLAAIGVVLPAALCMGMGIAFLCGLPSARELKAALDNLGDKLDVALVPHVTNLLGMLFWFGCLLIAAGIGLGVLVVLLCRS